MNAWGQATAGRSARMRIAVSVGFAAWVAGGCFASSPSILPAFEVRQVATAGRLVAGSVEQLISESAGNLISESAGNLISESAGNLTGTARGPAGLLADLAGDRLLAPYRLQAYQEGPAAGALVLLTTPDEGFYRYGDGRLAVTRADGAGAYRLEAAPKSKPVVVSVLLGRQRRLVGYTVPERDSVVDVGLATTYVTEFLRRHARQSGQSMAAFDTGKLPGVTALTQRALDEGRLGAVDLAAGLPDLTISHIPDLVAVYLAVIGRDRALGDAWKDLVGRRPLAVSTIAMDYSTADLPGQTNVGVTVDIRPDMPTVVYGASLTSSFSEVRRVVLDAAGRASSSALVHIAPRLGPSALGNPYGMAMERTVGGGWTGRLWYVDAAGASKLWTYDPVTAATATVAVSETVSGGVAPWSASAPTDITFDDRGVAYVVDQAHHRILRLDGSSGETLTPVRVAGTEEAGFSGDGGPATQARMSVPHGLTWAAGRLYIADAGNHRVRVIEQDGTITTLAGASFEPFGTRLLLGGFGGDGGPAAQALLRFPHKAIAGRLDGRDQLFVADGDNHRVRVVDFASGFISTLAGMAPEGGLPGDGEAQQVALGQLTYLALDRDGDLLVAETKRIRRLATRFGR